MAQTPLYDPFQIRVLRANDPKMRDRDFATKHALREAQLVAAHSDKEATRIPANPDTVMAAALELGEVMALTRNTACVHEKIGVYDNYHPGTHAAMVLTEEIDLRIFPSHWQHAYMVEKESDAGVRRSIQVFDASGDAVHKIFLRDGSNLAAWDRLRKSLAEAEQPEVLHVADRAAPEGAKVNLDKMDILRAEWSKMTDTHQFLRLNSKLKMNRLGAYRHAGAPFVSALAPEAVDQMLHDVQAAGIEIMLFVGNRGCIQIHTGPVETLKAMGPWQNVLDPGFNLHLRLDQVAEVWAVEKPTQRGPAISVEAFDADGTLIFQTFGVGKEWRDSRPAWNTIVEGLERLPAEEAV